MSDDCLFCKVLDHYQYLTLGSTFNAVLDGHPVTPGHLLIIPRRHVYLMSELTMEEWQILKVVIDKAILALEEKNLKDVYETFVEESRVESVVKYAKQMLQSPFLGQQPDGYNIGINEGRAAGMTIPHLHIHIIPRYKGDVDDPTGGVRHVIPEVGNYKDQ